METEGLLNVKSPETEMEYWEKIERLKDYVWLMMRGLASGEIQDVKGEIDKSIQEKKKETEDLINQLEEKFGVISPRNYTGTRFGQSLFSINPPDGKIYFFQWYKKMEREYYDAKYKGTICSACPFSQGLQKMIELDGNIPCKIYPGKLYKLLEPSRCAMLDIKDWSEEKLHKAIIKESNEDPEGALDEFLEKKWELTPKL